MLTKRRLARGAIVLRAAIDFIGHEIDASGDFLEIFKNSSRESSVFREDVLKLEFEKSKF